MGKPPSLYMRDRNTANRALSTNHQYSVKTTTEIDNVFRGWDALGLAASNTDLQALTGCIGLSLEHCDNLIQPVRACKSVLLAAGPKAS